MIRIVAFGALALCMGLAAGCSSTTDPATGTGGMGGVAGTHAAGGASGKGGGGGGPPACELAECLRPYECKRTCGGPIEHSGCCACAAPLFDDFLGAACGGAAGGRGGGAAGSGGAGRGGSSGAAGSGGAAAGRGGSVGSGGAAAGVGGAGRGGSSGAAGSAGSPGRGGGGGATCVEGNVQCLRPYECKRSCGGPIERSGCCPCEAPLFDDFGGLVCGDAGVRTASYAGCGFVGGQDRLSLSKVDAARDLCVYVRFRKPGAYESPGLTLWHPSWGAEAIGAGPAAACTDHSLFTVTTGSVTGTATEAPTMTSVPTVLSFELVLTFPASDAGVGFSEPMTATNLAVPGGGCVL